MILGRSWVALGRSRVALGSLLGRLGAALGCSWAVLGRSWALLGRSWVAFGRSWGDLGRSWGGLGRSWDGFGTVLGRFGVVLGRLLGWKSLIRLAQTFIFNTKTVDVQKFSLNFRLLRRSGKAVCELKTERAAVESVRRVRNGLLVMFRPPPSPSSFGVEQVKVNSYQVF